MPRKARASDVKPEIARRLKAARAIIYDSSDAAARALGVHKNTWRGWENADKYPDPFWLIEFCDGTGFTMDYLYRGRFRGIEEDVQIRLAAANPELVDEAPDIAESRRVAPLPTATPSAAEALSGVPRAPARKARRKAISKIQ